MIAKPNLVKTHPSQTQPRPCPIIATPNLVHGQTITKPNLVHDQQAKIAKPDQTYGRATVLLSLGTPILCRWWWTQYNSPPIVAKPNLVAKPNHTYGGAAILLILGLPVYAGGDGPVLGEDEDVEAVVLAVALKQWKIWLRFDSFPSGPNKYRNTAIWTILFILQRDSNQQ